MSGFLFLLLTSPSVTTHTFTFFLLIFSDLNDINLDLFRDIDSSSSYKPNLSDIDVSNLDWSADEDYEPGKKKNKERGSSRIATRPQGTNSSWSRHEDG